ncbi:hypothetical protein, partial [Phytoactinopolyspora endophytica]|uniref:hypothetical protein n=1 Tax=Phytoactinopolyspora endophytica TaxID=1642495 RepID=UPI0013EDEA55
MSDQNAEIDLGAEPDLYTEPLAYPGKAARAPGVLIGDRYRELRAADVRPSLRRLGVAGLDERCPVIAVGSNASPAQLWRKLAGVSGHLVVPITLVTVDDLAAGVSAHVSRAGYLPATPVAAPGERPTLAVVWLDAHQLPVMDSTEPNYDRSPLPVDRFPQLLEAETLAGRPCEIYVSRHGCLAETTGGPMRTRPQPEVIRTVLAESPALRELAGVTPEAF